MTEAKKRLADLMVGGMVFRGYYRTKWVLVWIHCLIQAVLYFCLYFQIGKNFLYGLFAFFVAFGISAGFIVWVAVAFWMTKALRVRRTINMLGKNGAEQALEELLASGKTCFSFREAIFGDHFAFFFQSGSVVAYDNIRQLYISKMPIISFRIWNHDLMAKTITGRWFLLARDRVYGRKSRKTLLLREYIDGLLSHYPDIAVSDK